VVKCQNEKNYILVKPLFFLLESNPFLDFSLLIDEGDEYPYAYLTGETHDGILFYGKDTVRLVGTAHPILEWLIERFPILDKIPMWLIDKLVTIG
jgi:hypothetical protein